jgi:hypothetical protein
MYELKHFGWFGRDASEKGVAGLTESLSLFAIAKGLVRCERLNS